MTTPSFYKNYFQVVAAIDSCLEKKQQLPALILIYTLIDSFAWIVYGQDEKSVRKRFENWCNRWILENSNLQVAATDLYAARCAILHTLTSDADLISSGRARRVVYAWGTADAAHLQEALQQSGMPDLVALHINEFAQLVREGIAKVMDACADDESLSTRLSAVAERHFASVASHASQPLDGLPN